MNPDDGAVTDGGLTNFKVRLLGFPSVTADGAPITGLGPGKPLALLVYLTVRDEARREELVDLLWGEVSEANARNAFRQALHRLRSALGAARIPMDRDRVTLVREGIIDVDRNAFLSAIDRGDVGSAIELYRGDFLDGFELGEPAFDSWADAERGRLKSRFQAALRSGAESALAAGRWLEALQYVQRLTALAPYEEDAVILEANVLIAAGRSSEALGSLRRFSQSLRDQLDLPVSARIREIAGRLERAQPSSSDSAVASSGTRKEPTFVAREAELSRLMSLATNLRAEQGGAVLIEGPAGIGKSRLVEEFVRRAKALGPMLVLRGRERPLGTALPYASIAEALRGALRAPGVAGTGRHLLAEAARILPELRDAYDLPEPGPIDAEGGRLRFFEGIAALVDSVAYEQPACIVLDDMQHASPSTLDLVAYLRARLASSPVLMVLLHRVDPGEPTLAKHPTFDIDTDELARLPLPPMSIDAISQLVRSVVGSANVENQLDIERVAVAAKGNPLRAIELARRALNGELPSAVPSPLREILWSRLQNATPSQRRVFFAAALLQRRCSLALLATAAHLPEMPTFEAARELESAGLLAQQDDGYVLAHDFTAAFVVEASGLAGRAMLAGWAADALSAETSASAELTNLYSLAGQQVKAFDHARRAVFQAAAVGSTIEAQRLLALALALAPDAASRESVERLSTALGDGKKLLADGFTPVVPSAASGLHVAPGSRPSSPAAEPAPAAPTSADAPQPPTDRADAASRRRMYGRLAALLIFGAIAVGAAVTWRQSIENASGARALADSLVLVERESDGESLIVTGALESPIVTRMSLEVDPPPPRWFRPLSLPWIRPSISPDGSRVAIERMTETGTDVYLADSIAAIPVATGGGIDAVLAWAPDGGAILVRRSKARADGAFDADLWAYRFHRGGVSAHAIDTSSDRSVEEAAWSPDGTRIAWVAQVGPTHQRDIFVSRANGDSISGLTDSPGEDYHISWASDGNLLAFTSDRDGNLDLFAIEFERRSRRMWRLTATPGDEDLARFSPDGRFVAYQSTGGGDAAVYVMPALGGVPTRVTPSGRQFSIAGWRGRSIAPFIDRFRIIAPTSVGVGDSIAVSVFGADRNGNSHLPESIEMYASDGARLLPVAAGSTAAAHRWVLHATRRGRVKLIAAIPGWRVDTLDIQVGDEAPVQFDGSFERGLTARWRSVGAPLPFVRRDSAGRATLYPNGDLQWQSGVLSTAAVSVDDLTVTATFVAPFAAKPVAAALLTLSLVTGQSADSLDEAAPQPSVLAGVAWDGEASRFTYSVGTESKSDPISSLPWAVVHQVRIHVDRDRAVRFFVDGRLRWTSSLRFLGIVDERSAHLWLGGRATGDRAGIRDLSVSRGR